MDDRRMIIPNWHPIFVNFTIALLTMSVIFFWVGRFIPFQRWQNELTIVARWCLWTAAIITIITVGLGFYAYYTVSHDKTQHAVMIIHRNWALIAMSILWITAIWSWFIYQKNKKTNVFFLITLLITLIAITITAWHGAELVFRHGVGVISTPKPQTHDHNH